MSDLTDGLFKRTKKGAGTLLNPDRPGEQVYVPARLVQLYRLVEGAKVNGSTRTDRGRQELVDIESICGLAPEEFAHRTPFPRLGGHKSG